jgi:hypothetical protein
VIGAARAAVSEAASSSQAAIELYGILYRISGVE